MSGFFDLPLFSITLTLGVYLLAQILYRRSGSLLLNPVAVTIAIIIATLVLADIPYASYQKGGDILLFLLGPSVVALGAPLYARREEIIARRRAIAAAIGIGGVVSTLSACSIAWILGASDAVIRSFAPKSVTTPIAIGIAEQIGGIAPLTAAVVVLTGCLGAILGPEFCRWIGLRSPVAIGLALGTASHGIGTARMLEIDRLGGAVAGLAIGLNGIYTTLLVPLLLALFPYI